MLRVEAWNDPNESQVAGILYVGWIDYHPVMKHQLENAFVQIIEDLDRSAISKLLLDSSQRRHPPADADFKEIYSIILGGLATTGLEKLARVCPGGTAREEKFRHYLREIKDDLQVGFCFRNFESPREALAWLQEDKIPSY